MKRAFTFIAGLTMTISSQAQIGLAGNTSLITNAAAGPGGKDVSATQSSYSATTIGSTQSHTLGFRIASRITVPSPGWAIDSLITYGYQTGSSLVSTFTGLYAYVALDSLSFPSSTVVIGNTASNIIGYSNWTGIYRSSSDTPPFTETTRPIMRIKSYLSGAIAPGNYWLIWSATGSLSSGPYSPPITYIGSASSGTNSYQYDPSTHAWSGIKDGTFTLDMPFKLWGKWNTATGIQEQSFVQGMTIAPNPVLTSARVTLDLNEKAGYAHQDLSFVIYDLLGKEVMRNNSLSGPEFTIEKGNLIPGNYFFRLVNKKDGQTVRAGKLIFQ